LKKFPRNKVITRGIDDLWQIDLADMHNIARFNKNFRYLVTCIDVFRKYAWVIPIKNKQAKSVLDAFKNIIRNSRRKINNLQSDQGTEFFNTEFKEYLSVVEHFNRTIKEKIYRFFTFKNTNNYISILDDLVLSYNNSFHRSIQTSPNKVNKKNEKKIHRLLYGTMNSKKPTFKFKKGMQVRISINKSIFEKGYTAKWTEEIFRIKHLIPREPIVYKIEDLNGEELKGVFYEQELQ
jgi:hypothetical protein